MSKDLIQTKLFASKGLRVIAAAALAAGLTTFGCTTNHMPGNGEPGVSGAPTMPTSTPGSSSGTEGTPPQKPPMASSYNRVDALAVAAANASFRGRYLGVADPGPSPTGGAPTAPTGQFVNPSLYANPEVTVNSSISSEPTPVTGVGTGSGGGGVVFVAPSTAVGTTAAVTSNATVSVASPTTLTTAAPTITSNPSVTTAATAAAPFTVGQFAAGPSVGSTVSVGTSPATTSVNINTNSGSLTPTVSSGATLSPTAASNPAVGSTSATMTTARSTATNSSAAIVSSGTAAIVSPFTRSSRTTAPVVAASGRVRALRMTDGFVITNR